MAAEPKNTVFADRLDAAVQPYLQIAGHVRSLIADGLISPGATVPSVRDLAREIGVAKGTVERAYDLLQRQGLIERNRLGLGLRVSEKPGALRESERMTMRDEFELLVTRLIAQRFSEADIRAAATSFFTTIQDTTS